MKNCLHCGQELADEAKFCFNCGKPLGENIDPVSVVMQPTTQQTKVKSYSELFQEWKTTDGRKYCLTNIFFTVVSILFTIVELSVSGVLFFFLIKSEWFGWLPSLLFAVVAFFFLSGAVGSRFLYIVQTCFFIKMKPAMADWMKARNVNPVRLVHGYLKDKNQDKVFTKEIGEKTAITKDFDINERNFVQASYLINVESKRKDHYKKHIIENVIYVIEMITFILSVFVFIFDFIPDFELSYFWPVVLLLSAVSGFAFINDIKRAKQESKEREIWLKNNIYNKSDEEIEALYKAEQVEPVQLVS